jgi:hypothetical protein
MEAINLTTYGSTPFTQQKCHNFVTPFVMIKVLHFVRNIGSTKLEADYGPTQESLVSQLTDFIALRLEF